MAVRELTDGNVDGTRLGQATSEKLGFYGLATPIVRPSHTAYSTTTAATSTSPFGFTTSTQANALNTAVIELSAAVRALGLAG